MYEAYCDLIPPRQLRDHRIGAVLRVVDEDDLDRVLRQYAGEPLDETRRA